MGSDGGVSPELKELLAAVRKWKSEDRPRPNDSQPRKTAERLLIQGRLDEALDWFQRAALEGDPTALRRAAAAVMARSADEAVHWYQRAFEASDVSAAWRAGRIRRNQGRDLEAIEWYQRGAKAGDRTALQRVAYLMRDRGRLDEAVEWSKKACTTGDKGAFFLTVQLLSLQGREEEASKLRQFGWELDGSIAEPWTSLAGHA
uniref:hypothetical protein n=1 Tax=Streptomyces sp. CA-136453 TaxID=3240050 RepID=UPI003F49120E